MLKPTVFFDRDGVLNIDKGHVYKISDFEWNKGAKEAIKFLNNKQYLIIVVTNQAGIAKKLYTENDMAKLHNFMNSELNKISAKIDDFFYSPWHPEIENDKYLHLKDLRKPNSGMLELAEKKWPIDKKKSFLVGDKETDLMAANNFGIKGFLFKDENLLEFIIKILKNEN